MSSGELDHIVGMEIQASSENLTELKIAAEKSKSMGQWGGNTKQEHNPQRAHRIRGKTGKT